MKRDSLRRALTPGFVLGLLLGGTMATVAVASPRNVTFDQEVGLGGEGIYQHESSVAFNPANPSNLAVAFPDVYPRGANPAGVCRSTWTSNGGMVWHAGGTTPLLQRPGARGVDCGDPSIAADTRGNFYLAYLNANFGGAFFPYDVFVAKSTDGGESFPTYSVAVPAQAGVNDADKPYIAADTHVGSPFQDSLYVAWTNFGDHQSIQSVFSRDGGQTWSTPIDVSAPVNISGALPVVAPDGTVYIFWMVYAQTSAKYLEIQFAKSQNGGVTWSAPADVASGLPSPGFFYLKNAEPSFGSYPYSGLAGNSHPAAAAGPDGTLYVAWTDFPSGRCKKLDRVGDFACSNADVRLSVSRDGGQSWTPPVKVSDDGTNQSDQFFPWIATHPDGLVSIAWIDRRLDPNNIDYNTFYTNTTDGVNFLPNVRVSSVTSPLGLNHFIGDYIGMAATDGRVFPAWGDFRLGHLTDFTARGTLQN